MRKRNIVMEDYKREKRHAIPSWLKSLAYTKSKPDLVIRDKENHLSSGSVKFGLLVEMLKAQGRITVYERVITLLNAINEETV